MTKPIIYHPNGTTQEIGGVCVWETTECLVRYSGCGGVAWGHWAADTELFRFCPYCGKPIKEREQT